MSIKKIFAIIVLFFILINICTYSFASLIDDALNNGKNAITQGLTDASSVLVQVLVGIYRIIQIGVTAWALIRLTWLGIKYFTTASMATPQELKGQKAELVNHLIRTCAIIGAESIVELIYNALTTQFS